MKIYISRVIFCALFAYFSFLINPAFSEQSQLPLPEVNEDGVYTQPWFFDSFLNLKEDLAESQTDKKQLAILWEQRGCPYCKETHLVNLRIPSVVDYIKKNFNVIQLNLWGDREVTDFDGEITTEKKLARKYRIQFTPTIQFFSQNSSASLNTNTKDFEVWRVTGYWKPFHFLNTFVYVNEKGYIQQPNFQRWLQAHAEELRKKGIEFKLW